RVRFSPPPHTPAAIAPATRLGTRARQEASGGRRSRPPGLRPATSRPVCLQGVLTSERSTTTTRIPAAAMCRASPRAVAGGALDTGQADLAESFYGPTPADPVREGVRAGRGDLVAVADVEGGRPGILWAVADADPGRRLSAGHRPGTGASGLFPAAREDFR